MARVTIEDCLEKVDDRFELVGLASQRARDIASGSEITIERNGEKDTVIALREIAEGTVKSDDLREEYVSSFEDEKSSLEGFIAPANDAGDESVDSISIDEEEADIKAAMFEASEGTNSEAVSVATGAIPEGFVEDELANAGEEDIEDSEEE